MKYKVPFYSKKYFCIACGCKVGKNGKSHIKKGVSIGIEKHLEYWLKYELLISNDHRLCEKCSFNEDLEIKTKDEEEDINTDLEFLIEKITIQLKKNQLKPIKTFEITNCHKKLP